MAQAKGRRPPEHLLLSKVQVARTLGLPPAAVSKMIVQGILVPVTGEGEKPKFHVSDVAEILPLIEKKVHLSKIWNRILATHARCVRNERRIDDILALLGAKEETLPLEEWAMDRLFNRISKYLKMDLRFLTAEEVLEWAKVFIGMDMSYLRVAALFFNTQEPWYMPMLLGQKMVDEAPREEFSDHKDLSAAYGYFTYAFRSFREQAYFFCRTVTGSAKEANRKFPERTGNLTREITRLISLGLAEAAVPPKPARKSKLH